MLVAKFYSDNADLIDRHRVGTLDFDTGMETAHKYTLAKVIDMIFFVEGGEAAQPTNGAGSEDDGKGVIYVVTTVTRDYDQMSFASVPTEWKGRLSFGPCKMSMRPSMWPGDWVFGISPANGTARRIVFAVELEERMTFAEAYDRFPDLRGPGGPIHVRPADGFGTFPESSYEHIPGANCGVREFRVGRGG